MAVIKGRFMLKAGYGGKFDLAFSAASFNRCMAIDLARDPPCLLLELRDQVINNPLIKISPLRRLLPLVALTSKRHLPVRGWNIKSSSARS